MQPNKSLMTIVRIKEPRLGHRAPCYQFGVIVSAITNLCYSFNTPVMETRTLMFGVLNTSFHVVLVVTSRPVAPRVKFFLFRMGFFQILLALELSFLREIKQGKCNMQTKQSAFTLNAAALGEHSQRSITSCLLHPPLLCFHPNPSGYPS